MKLISLLVFAGKQSSPIDRFALVPYSNSSSELYLSASKHANAIRIAIQSCFCASHDRHVSEGLTFTAENRCSRNKEELRTAN